MAELSLVRCEICGRLMNEVCHFHLKIHNVTYTQYKQMFPNSETIPLDIRKRCSDALRSGITSETYIKISKSIKKLWSDRAYREMMYNSKNNFVGKNRLPVWNKGLTKDMNEAVNRISLAKMGDKNPVRRLDVRIEMSKVIKKKWKENHGKWLATHREHGFGWYCETKEHRELKTEVSEFLRTLWYSIRIEKIVKIKNKYYFIDVFGYKLNDYVVVECGGCSKNKILELKKRFKIVIHIPYDTSDVAMLMKGGMNAAR